MRERMIPHEARAYRFGHPGLVYIATCIGALNEIEHVVGQGHHALGRLHHSAAKLRCGAVGDVLMFGNQGNLLVGQITVVQAVANR